MKYLLIFFFIFYSNLIYSKKIYFEEMLSYEITTETFFSDGSKYQTFSVKGGVTFSTGVYAIKNCSGDRTLKEENLIDLKSICKYKISDDEYLWSKVLGNDRYAEKGTGKFQLIDGTGVYKNLVGYTCDYALNIFDEIIFGKGVCEIDENVYKKINKN